MAEENPIPFRGKSLRESPDGKQQRPQFLRIVIEVTRAHHTAHILQAYISTLRALLYWQSKQPAQNYRSCAEGQ